MDLISSILTTRETALGIWILILTFIFSLDKNVRGAMKNLLKCFFVSSILFSVIALAIYVTIVTFGLNYFGLWTQSLLKDTIIWSVTVAFVMQMNAIKIKDISYFKNIVKDTLKWTIVLEFVLSLYSFSLWTELVLIPFLILLGALQGYSMTDKKYEKVRNLLSIVIAIISAILILISIYKTFQNFNGLWTINNLISLIYPVIMALFFIPFIYCYAVYMKYDELFSLTNHWAKDKKKARNIKKQILWTAKLNLWTLWIIRFNLYKVDFTNYNLNDVIKKMVNENQLPTQAISHAGTVDI